MYKVKKTSSCYDILSKTFLFCGVESGSILAAFRSPECTCMAFESGEAVYTRRVYHRSLGVVLAGRLKAVKAAPEGSAVVLNTFSSGNVFGAASLFNSTQQYVSDIYAMRRSRVLFLPQELLQELFRKEPAVAENYIAFLSGRICFLNRCIDHYTGGSAKSRLFAYLASLPALAEEPETVEMPCSMTRLADMLGIGRASLYRAFDELEMENKIRREGRKIIRSHGFSEKK
jgi:CRP-like cAMP-binding protein